MIYIFWISLVMLLYTYIGYPLYVWVRAKYFKMPVRKDPDYKPYVSVIMSVYNEEAFIEKKIENLLGSEYPRDRMEIIIGSDGSTDSTNDMLKKRAHADNVKVSIFPARRGKPAVLNSLVSTAKGEILVFCDVRQLFDKDAVAQLASNLADENVGCVSGELVFAKSSPDNGVAKGVDTYWTYEKLIRKNESSIHSMVGATGAIYAIRKSLYTALPKDIILDDVYTPLAIARKGYRCVWDADAKAYDKPASSPGEEYRRKVRTLAGNYQIFGMFKDLLIPFRNKVSMPLLSHKFLRVIAPFFMITLFMSNIYIAKNNAYILLLIAQTIFYALAVLGAATYKRADKKFAAKIASAIYIFCLMNFTALAGLYRFLFGKQSIAWEK